MRLLGHRLPVTSEDVGTVLAAFGRSAVLYRVTVAGWRSFFASTAILKLTATATGILEVELAAIDLFETPVEIEAGPPVIGRAISTLPVEILNDIVARDAENRGSRSDATLSAGFHEPGTAFHPDVTAEDFLKAYDYRCAFTGQSLAAAAAADPLGVLLRLGSADERLRPGLAIPACADAIGAYERGHLSLFSNGGFILAPEYADPELLERLRPIGRLAEPTDPAFQPNQGALARHRRDFMHERLARS
jgi:hypothetical protein